MREKIAQLIDDRLFVQIANGDLDVNGVLSEELSARATGWGESFCCGHDGDLTEAFRSFREGFQQGHPLGADGQSVAGVLDVAAGEHRAILGQQRSPDGEAGVLAAGEVAGLDSEFE